MSALPAEPTLDAHWHDLFAAALLGTDRRSPPAAPAGPIAELLVELPPLDGARGLLDQVAVTVALRRAGLAAVGPVAPLLPPPTDPRPEIPAGAAARLAHVIDAWPMLEAEWLGTVVEGGWRLGPDAVVTLLRRHRTDPQLRPLVELAAGPLATWICDQVPSLAPARQQPRAPTGGLTPSLVGVADRLVVALAGTPTAFVEEFARWLRGHRLTAADRAPLVAVLVQVPPAVLPGLASLLGEVYTDAAGTMLAAYLADLAMTRHQMLLDLAPPPRPPTTDR